MSLSLHQIGEMQQAREKIVTTAVSMRKAMLNRDALYEQPNQSSFEMSARLHAANEEFEMLEAAHHKAIKNYFTICKKLELEPS